MSIRTLIISLFLTILYSNLFGQSYLIEDSRNNSAYMYPENLFDSLIKLNILEINGYEMNPYSLSKVINSKLIKYDGVIIKNKKYSFDPIYLIKTDTIKYSVNSLNEFILKDSADIFYDNMSIKNCLGFFDSSYYYLYKIKNPYAYCDSLNISFNQFRKTIIKNIKKINRKISINVKYTNTSYYGSIIFASVKSLSDNQLNIYLENDVFRNLLFSKEQKPITICEIKWKYIN